MLQVMQHHFHIGLSLTLLLYYTNHNMPPSNHKKGCELYSAFKLIVIVQAFLGG